MEYSVYNREDKRLMFVLTDDTTLILFARMIRDEKKELRHIDTAGQALYYLDCYCETIEVKISK